MHNRYLDFLIDPSFQVVNRLFVLSFANEGDRESLKKTLSSNYRNEKLKCYDRWKKFF